MALEDALEIERRQAKLNRPLLQKIAVVAPWLFLVMFFCGGVSVFFSSHPQREVQELKIYALVLFLVCLALVWLHLKNQRRIALLELELLKLKRH